MMKGPALRTIFKNLELRSTRKVGVAWKQLKVGEMQTLLIKILQNFDSFEENVMIYLKEHHSDWFVGYVAPKANKK